MVKDLKNNSNIFTSFLVEKVVQGISNTGTAYLAIILKDKTGTIEARLWNSQREDLQKIIVGSIIEIKGIVTEYQKNLQIKINSYSIITDDTIDFSLFVAKAPLTETFMWQQIQEFVNKIENSSWKMIVETILQENQADFLSSPAAVRHHHNVRSGLIWHTLTMLQAASAICSIYQDRNLNSSLLYAGIILHDMGKTKELVGKLTTEYSVQGKLIGHISIMAAEIAVVAKKLTIPESEALILQHMVLASHGRYDFGSPVLPQIMEAEILSQLDNLDAKIYAIASALEQTNPNEFSARIPGLENRSFYRFNK